jgi:hypothetical protein
MKDLIFIGLTIMVICGLFCLYPIMDIIQYIILHKNTNT